MTAQMFTFREHEPFNGICSEDRADLAQYTRKVLKRKDGDLAASNHVGVITTKRGTVVEILPKFDLSAESDSDHETTRFLFLRMLRSWRRMGRTLPESAIRSMNRYPMLEIFVHRFLMDLAELARSGLARHYILVEGNLPTLRGRIVFREHFRSNLVNKARFYVAFDELSVNRPANRLIRSTLTKLLPLLSDSRNRQSLRELLTVLNDIPQSSDFHVDWRKHHIDRSMQHYEPVMAWVRLFLFDQGLATYSGSHTNLSLLFPMEQVYEDYIYHCFRRYQDTFTAVPQGPLRKLASLVDEGSGFGMKPDISLKAGNRIAFILDAKWKHIDPRYTDSSWGIQQDDVYQLFAYAKAYGCDVVAMIYPRTQSFRQSLKFRFFDNSQLICLPFDIQNPRVSVRKSIQILQESNT